MDVLDFASAFVVGAFAWRQSYFLTREPGGLIGIERRLAAFDGTLSMASPLGGPTILTMKVPCLLQATASA